MTNSTLEKSIESFSGKNDGDKYRVKDECINMVYRKIHGNIIEIFVDEFLETEIGFLSKKYTSQQIDPNTLKPNSQKLEYEDQFINIGTNNIWILNSRTIKYLNKNHKYLALIKNMKRLWNWIYGEYKLWKLKREDPYIYEDEE